MATSVYILCMVTSAICAGLLLREFRRSGSRLLLWSALSFILWAVNNALVFTDLVVLPDRDLSVARTLALVAICLMLFGLVWDAA